MKTKKVISYSLWSDIPKYNFGAIRNAELAREIFPDWTVRFYIGTSVPNETVDQLRLQLYFKNPQLISQTAVRIDYH